MPLTEDEKIDIEELIEIIVTKHIKVYDVGVIDTFNELYDELDTIKKLLKNDNNIYKCE